MPPRSPKKTVPTAKVLEFMLNSSERSFYGREIVKATGLPTGTVYPIFARLEALHWLGSEWRDNENESLPRRRYYWLTEDGETEARKLVGSFDIAHTRAGSASAPTNRPGQRPRWAPILRLDSGA